MSNFRYVAIRPDRIERKKEIGPASYLHDFLVDHQTDAEGNVNYGKPFGYAWIRAKWPGVKPPPIRTLKRHMARLKKYGQIWTRAMPLGRGMIVRVLNSAKWAPQAERARQMSLYAPEPVSISSGKGVDKPLKSGALMGPKVAPLGAKSGPVMKLRT